MTTVKDVLDACDAAMIDQARRAAWSEAIEAAVKINCAACAAGLPMDKILKELHVDMRFEMYPALIRCRSIAIRAMPYPEKEM